jgi:hypothetical protein
VPRGSRIRPAKVEGAHIRAVTVGDSTFAEGVATVRWREVQLPDIRSESDCFDTVSKVELIGGYPGCFAPESRPGRRCRALRASTDGEAAEAPEVQDLAIALCALALGPRSVTPSLHLDHAQGRMAGYAVRAPRPAGRASVVVLYD